MKITLPVLLLALLGFSNPGISFSQLSNENISQLNPDADIASLLNGDFHFSYNGITHKINITNSSMSFEEFDFEGVELGKGTYYINDQFFVFLPDEVSSESFITEPLKVRILDHTDIEVRLIVQSIEGGKGIIIKLNKL